MDLYFSQAEQPIYLRQLDAIGATHIAVSFYEWRRRHSSDALHKHIPAHMKVCVTAGIAKKEALDFKTFADDYIDFCEQNAEQVLVYDMDAPFAPASVQQDVRNRLSVLPNVVVFPKEGETPSSLATVYERIGINARMAKSIPATELRRIPATLYGSNITDAKTLRAAHFAATTSAAWLSPRRYGELWVFARGRLHHYSAENLARAVRAHRANIEAFGVDPDACAAKDYEAMTACAVISLQLMAESLSRRPRDRAEPEAPGASPESSEGADGAPAPTSPGALMASMGIGPPIERERITLPVITLNVEDGEPKVSSADGSQRQCNSCYLNDACPAFKPSHTCAFDLPIKIRGRADWEAATQAMLEMQFKRVGFAVFAEEVEGVGITARPGQEMDRFNKLLKDVKDLEQMPDTEGNGAMSKIFGTEEDVEGQDLAPILGSNGYGQTEESSQEVWDEEGAIDAVVADEEEGADA